MEEISDEGIHGLSFEMFGHKRKNRRALKEASVTCKALIFFF